MDVPDLDAFLRARAQEVDINDQGCAWEFEVEGVYMVCLADARHDRMRLIAPILDVRDMTDDQRDAVLEANFHTALDARYATSEGVLFAAFIHPLGSLGAEALESALEQVAALVETFGTSYSSGALVFGVPGPQRELN